MTAPAADEPVGVTMQSLSDALSLREATDDFQRRWLRDALTRHAGNQAAGAREAGMHRSNLFRLIKRLGRCGGGLSRRRVQSTCFTASASSNLVWMPPKLPLLMHSR
jgi:hypothetical protein